MKSPRSLGLRSPLLLVALGSVTASAHDTYSSWAEAILHADRIELTLTLARPCAHQFLPDAATEPPITPENFTAIRPRLRQIASTLFDVTVSGKSLPLNSGEVKISGDVDVNFTLTYPRPGRGNLRFFAVFLGHLVDGHTLTLVVSDPEGKDLGWSPLTMHANPAAIDELPLLHRQLERDALAAA